MQDKQNKADELQEKGYIILKQNSVGIISDAVGLTQRGTITDKGIDYLEIF